MGRAAPALLFLIGTILPGVTWAGPLPAQSEEPVLIQGSQLPALAGARIDRLGVFAYRGGFAPIPFQVDERDPNGRWVLRSGPNPTQDADQGRLDANDEMVFMASDLADRAPEGQRPESGKPCLEVRARDPESPAEGYAYVCAFESQPKLSKVNYVDFEATPQEWLVKTPFYQAGGLEGASYFDRLNLVGKDGRAGDNLLDTQKVRGILSLSGQGKRLRITERNGKTQTRGWCDGPVRVIRVRSGMVKVAGLEITVPGFAANFHYRSFFMTPLNFDLPLNANLLFKYLNFSTTLDYSPAVYGWRYYDARRPAGLPVNGVMDETEKQLRPEGTHEWYALAGKPGNVLVRIVMGPGWRGSVIPTLYYLDDASVNDPPENIPGACRFGFQFKMIQNIPKGAHRYDLYYFFPRDPSSETRDNLFRIMDAPLKIEISGP